MKISSMMFSAAVAVVLSACGGDPLVGTWKTTTDPAASLDGSTSYTSTLVLTSGKTFTLTTTTVYGASAPANAGCTGVSTISGTYTETSTTYAATGTAGSPAAYTGCTNTANNNPSPTPYTAAELSAAGVITSTYTVSGNTLTINQPAIAALQAPALTLVYTKG